MCNKKRKRPNSLVKQDVAHFRNVFTKKILEIAKMVSLHESYKLITPRMLDVMFNVRCRMIKMVVDDNLKISSDELQKIKESIVCFLKNEYLEFKNTGYRLSLYEWAGPGVTLYSYLDYLRSHESENHPRLLMAFEDLLHYPDFWAEVRKGIYVATNYMGWELSSPDKKIFSFKVSFKLSEPHGNYIYIEVKVKAYQPQVSHVTLDDSCRPVYRMPVFCNGQEPTWFSFEARDLGLKHVPDDTIVPVYIQSHALKRLSERIDCADNALIYSNLIVSLEEKVYRWYKGGLLIEYKFDGVKIGYLLVDIVKEKAVIRTFLMLTHFETPEGDTLHKLIGFEKADILYLNLDKISTFVFADLGEKSLLCNLFSRAGCGSLFQLDKFLFQKGKIVSGAGSVETYLSKYAQYTEQTVWEEMLSA
jgi:hypothetical protein